MMKRISQTDLIGAADGLSDRKLRNEMTEALAASGETWKSPHGEEKTFKGVEMKSGGTKLNILETSHMSSDVWQEFSNDICINVYPPNREISFGNEAYYFNVVSKQLSYALAHAIGLKHKVSLEEYGIRFNRPGRARQSDIDQKGMDTLAVRVHGLYKVPLAAKKIIEALIAFHQVLSGGRKPLLPYAPRHIIL